MQGLKLFKHFYTILLLLSNLFFTLNCISSVPIKTFKIVFYWCIFNILPFVAAESLYLFT